MNLSRDDKPHGRAAASQEYRFLLDGLARPREQSALGRGTQFLTTPLGPLRVGHRLRR